MTKWVQMNRSFIVYLIILLIGFFYIKTIREGHNWGGDFSMYIHHAKNIAEGKSYNDTGYLYNPLSPSLGPKTYPPVFPLILAPIYVLFGLNLKIMKIVIVLFFLLSLFVIYLNFKNDLPLKYLILLLIILGPNYYFWNFKDRVLSDIPFLFFTYTSLFLIRKMNRFRNYPGKVFLLSIFAGISMYLSYGTRSLGIIFLPSLIIYEYLNYKKLSKPIILALSIFIAFALLQSFLCHNGGSYFDQITFDFRIIFKNSILYLKNVAGFLNNTHFLSLKVLIFFTVSIGAILGFILNLHKNIGIYEIFIFFYISVIIIWPSNQGTRFLIPLLPLYIYYFLVSFYTFNKSKYGKISLFLFCAIISGIIVSNVLKYVEQGFRPIPRGIHKQESLELFNFIKTKTKESEIIIFDKPRILTLFSGRKSSLLHFTENDEELWKYINQVGANYLIYSTITGSNRERELNSFIRRNKQKLDLIFSNEKFEIFKIRRPSKKENAKEIGTTRRILKM
jgi:hypothetical protein